MEMVERILLLHLESEMDKGSSESFCHFRHSEPLPPPPLEMNGRVYARCVRSSMTYGSETEPLLADVELKFERADMQMIR